MNGCHNREPFKDGQVLHGISSATGRMGTTGTGLQAFRGLFEVHDLQRSSVQRSDYEKLIAKSMSRIRTKAKEVVEL